MTDESHIRPDDRPFLQRVAMRVRERIADRVTPDITESRMGELVAGEIGAAMADVLARDRELAAGALSDRPSGVAFRKAFAIKVYHGCQRRALDASELEAARAWARQVDSM